MDPLVAYFIEPHGLAVVVTGSGERARDLVRRLEGDGAHVRHVPVPSERDLGDAAVVVACADDDPDADAATLDAAASCGVAAVAWRAEHERFGEILRGLREKLEERFPDAERRSRIWQDIIDSPVLDLLRAGSDDDAQELAERMAWGTG